MKNDDGIYEDDAFNDEEFDELEKSTLASSSRPLVSRRIELIKEMAWLKQQTADFDDWEIA